MAIKNLFNQNNNSPSDPSNVLTTPKTQTKTQSNRQTPTYAKNYNNTVKTINNKLGIDKEVKRTTDKLKTSSSEQKQNSSAIEPVNEKTSNKAQEKANKTTVNYARNNFNSDKEYERYLTENKVSLTSGNALDYINQKAKEKGVSARDYAKEMHTLTNNTIETEKLEAKAKNGELSDNDMESLNQFHAYIDKDNNIIDDDKLQSQNELYKTTIDTINNDVNKLNEQYTKGKISIEDYQNKYAQLEERWNSNQELGNYLENVNLKTGFDYYNWAKENNLDVSEFEKYAESFNDGIVERLTEDFAAATTDLLNTPVQLYDMAKSVFDKDFNMLDENNASTQMANESTKLRNYVMAGTNGAGRIGAQIVDSLMPMAVSALTGNVLGTALGVGSQSLTGFANNFTNVSLGAQNAGQVTRQRLEEGNDVASSVVNGIAHGVITGLVEGLDAGRVASIFTGDAKNYILGTALLGKTSFGNIVKFLNATGASEGAEEVIETFADWAADNVQNMIGGVIGGENYSPVEVTQLDPSEMAQQFALAYAGALVLGTPTAVGVAVNSKKTYNAAIEARNYAESTLNSPLADEGSKRIAKLTIDAINADIEEYNQTKTPLSDGVTFENERVDSLGTFDEAVENLVQTSRLDIKDNLNQTIGVLQNLNKTETLIQKSLNDRGIDITAHDYLNLSNEAKQNVKTLMKSINNMDGKFPYEVSFDGRLNQDVNGYVKDGKIVLNPNVNTNYESVLAHEVTHTLENSKNYKTIEDLIKGSNDYQSYYDKYSKLYKGVADNVDSEVMAKYIENNLGNKGLIDKLVKYDESLGYRIYEELKSNFSSDLDTKVENAWLKSFEEAKKQSRTGLQFSINEDSEGKYVSISDNIFDSNDVTRQDKLKKIDSFIKELIDENAKYTYTLEENDIKKEVGVNRNTRKKLRESKGPETAIEIRGSILNNLKDIFKDVEFSHEDNKKINGIDTNRPASIGENGFDKGTIRIVDPVGGKEYVATITISNQANSNYLYSIFSKEKEGAGHTVSDNGPRVNPKAPSYLNDTNISEKSNIQNVNALDPNKKYSLNEKTKEETYNEVENIQQGFIDNFEHFGLDTKRKDINKALKKDLSSLTQYIIDNGTIDETLKNDVIDDLIKAGKKRGTDIYSFDGQSNPKEIRDYLKKSGTVWDSIKDDVQDKGDFMKRHFGTFNFRDKGSLKGQLSQGWDAQLQELVNLFPDFISSSEAQNIKSGYEYVELVDNKLADLNEKWNGYHFDELDWGMKEADFESKIRERASGMLDIYAQEVNQTAGIDKRMEDLANKTSEENFNQLLSNPEELEKEYASLFGDKALDDVVEPIKNTENTSKEDSSTGPIYRSVEIPAYNEQGKVSKGAKTIAESSLVSDETSKAIIDKAKEGKLNTRGLTNKAMNTLVNDKINELKTFDNCYKWVMGKVTVEDGALASALGTKLIESTEAQIKDLKANGGDIKTIENLQGVVDELSSRTIKLASASGDTVRQHANFKSMTLEGQINFIEESINDIQEQLNRQRGDKAPKLELKNELIEEWRNATTEEARTKVAEKIVQDIASQVPPTIIDQLNAWRHLSMLFNPRTWIKNSLANTVAGQVSTLKQAIQKGIEAQLFAKYNPSEARINEYANNEEIIKKAKALDISPVDYARMELGKHADVYNPIADRELLNRFVKDYDSNYKDFKTKYAGGDISTYLGSGEFAQAVNEAKKQFSADGLNNLVDVQSKFMSDAPAMRKAYAKTMIGWLKANNLSFDELTPTQLAYARDYAFNQARIITFNEESKMANNIGKFSNTNLATKLIVDSMVPFKRTPINILKQGINYSPVGLMKTITYNAYQLSKGKITTSQFSSNLASGLTGAGVMGLGYILAKMGLFRTKDDDKDKKKRFDENNGEQDYAIVTPWGSYTIDWLDPFIMPLSMGAEVANGADNLSADDAFDLFLSMEEPIFETSMLSGLRKSFQSYDSDDAKWFNNLVSTVASNYASQYVPTIFGAAARTIDDTRRTTYPNNGTLDKTIKTVANKIPLLSKTNQPYINKEGEEQKNEDLGLGAVGRAFLNFISPGYYASKKIDKYDEELYRLYDKTGVLTVFPSDSAKSVTYDGDTYNLIGEDYTNWNKTRLSLETEYVNKFIDSDTYSNYDDSQKAKIIGDIRTYAGQSAKKDLLESKGVKYDDTSYKKASEALENDLDLYQYYGANDYYNDLTGDTKKTEYLDYIDNLETSDKGKNYLYDSKYGGTKLSSYINDMNIDDTQKLAAKEANARAESKKDEEGNTITNSKSIAVAKAYSDAGILDDVFSYIEQNGLKPSDMGLSKTVYNYSEDELIEAYEEVFGSDSNGVSTKKTSRTTSKTVKSTKTTTVKAQNRLGDNVSSSSRNNSYANVDFINAYMQALESKNKELQKKYSEKIYE